MIEKNFDIAFIADLALREKQIQQNYRPVIAVHKWFARRPGTLFRGLLLAEFGEDTVSSTFYRGHAFRERKICDPFMGGGTPLLEANRMGCDVIGFDINPMARWIVQEELDHIDVVEYREAANHIGGALEREVGHLYRTQCVQCGAADAAVKYFLWVKIQMCSGCGIELDLFPGYLVADDTRHPNNVFVCGRCGELSECKSRNVPGACSSCGEKLSVSGPARRNRCACSACGTTTAYPNPESGPPRHRMFAIEYHCPACKPSHSGRFFKKPDLADFQRLAEAESRRSQLEGRFIPTEEVPTGDESDRLHRWGYMRYSDMFNDRQLVGLQRLCTLIKSEPSERMRRALATNLSDLLRYQNMLCRYDTMALKSLDIFSVHGFPVGLIQCESNLLGITSTRGLSVGSGGWTNVVEKYAKAKAFCERPFEIRHDGGRKVKVAIPGEWIGGTSHDRPEHRSIVIRCADSAQCQLEPDSLDAVLTDPPYFRSVQYAELMDFCYVWLRRLIDNGDDCFSKSSTRDPAELTGNDNMNRGLEHFTDGLSAVFQKMAIALKATAPLAFTYHNNKLDAYYPVAVALLDAGFVCTLSIPCPAEMGASIHINGTGSSIIDTIFVCRKDSTLSSKSDLTSLRESFHNDQSALRKAGVKPTAGDLRCIAYGHLTRYAVQHLRGDWNRTESMTLRLDRVRKLLEPLKNALPYEQHNVDRLENEPPSLLPVVVAISPQ